VLHDCVYKEIELYHLWSVSEGKNNSEEHEFLKIIINSCLLLMWTKCFLTYIPGDGPKQPALGISEFGIRKG